MQIGKDVPLESISQRHELSGGEIMNIVHYACLQTLELNQSFIFENTLLKV